MANTFPTFQTPVFAVTEAPIVPPEQRFIDRFRETVRSYVMGSRWTLMDFAETRYQATLQIRISLRPPGANEDLDLAFAYDLPSMLLTNRYEEIGHAEINNAIRTIEDEMAQWNQRRNDRLIEQQRQRQEAAQRNRGEETRAQEAVEYRPLEVSIGDYLATPGHGITMTDPYTFQTIGTGVSRPFFDTRNTSIANTQWVGTTLQPAEDENVVTFKRSEFKDMLRQALEELDIKISLDISDGEVTAEVEVLFDGAVVTSDSDSIYL